MIELLPERVQGTNVVGDGQQKGKRVAEAKAEVRGVAGLNPLTDDGARPGRQAMDGHVQP